MAWPGCPARRPSAAPTRSAAAETARGRRRSPAWRACARLGESRRARAAGGQGRLRALLLLPSSPRSAVALPVLHQLVVLRFSLLPLRQLHLEVGLAHRVLGGVLHTLRWPRPRPRLVGELGLGRALQPRRAAGSHFTRILLRALHRRCDFLRG